MRLFERGTRRLLAAVDAVANRVYGWRWNPIHQSGTVAVAMLLALIGTGLYLVLIYRVGDPAASVARLAGDPWIGRWMRSFHRYASDLFLLAAGLHLLRMFAQSRSWGPRTLAWVSGLVLFGAGLVCAWTGFVMAWDTFGERLAPTVPATAPTPRRAPRRFPMRACAAEGVLAAQRATRAATGAPPSRAARRCG